MQKRKESAVKHAPNAVETVYRRRARAGASFKENWMGRIRKQLEWLFLRGGLREISRKQGLLAAAGFNLRKMPRKLKSGAKNIFEIIWDYISRITTVPEFIFH